MEKQQSLSFYDKVAHQPLKVFLLWCLMAGLFAAFLLWITSFMVEKRWIVEPGDGLAASVGVIVGAAVAFAGSMVAIVIASITLGLQKRHKELMEEQDRREDLLSSIEVAKFVSDRLDGYIKPYASLLSSLSRLYLFVVVNSAILWNRGTVSFDSSKSVGFDARAFLIEFNRRAEAVVDDLDRFNFRDAPLLISWKVKEFLSFSICINPGSSETEVVFFDKFPTVIEILRSQIEDLRKICNGSDDDIFKRLNYARNVASKAVSKDNQELNDVAVRDLFLMGAIFFPYPGRRLDRGWFRPLLPELWMNFVNLADKLHEIISDNPILNSGDSVIIKVFFPENFSHLVDKDHKEVLRRYKDLDPRVYLQTSNQGGASLH